MPRLPRGETAARQASLGRIAEITASGQEREGIFQRAPRLFSIRIARGGGRFEQLFQQAESAQARRRSEFRTSACGHLGGIYHDFLSVLFLHSLGDRMGGLAANLPRDPIVWLSGFLRRE